MGSILEDKTYNKWLCSNSKLVISLSSIKLIKTSEWYIFSALTVDDEKRQISLLIAQFLLRVDHGRDFEQQLSFYVDARAAFSNLDYVHAALVQVNKKT